MQYRMVKIKIVKMTISGKDAKETGSLMLLVGIHTATPDKSLTFSYKIKHVITI